MKTREIAHDGAVRFIAATVTDPAVAADFEALVDGRSPAEAEADIVRFANARGYAVDAAALRRVRADLAQRSGTEGTAIDLTDEALDTASGGLPEALVALLTSRTIQDPVTGRILDKEAPSPDIASVRLWLGL